MQMEILPPPIHIIFDDRQLYADFHFSRAGPREQWGSTVLIIKKKFLVRISVSDNGWTDVLVSDCNVICRYATYRLT